MPRKTKQSRPAEDGREIRYATIKSSLYPTETQAGEMMAYTKNNILIQSAQAMLAQANQVPQGVLQLLR